MQTETKVGVSTEIQMKRNLYSWYKHEGGWEPFWPNDVVLSSLEFGKIVAAFHQAGMQYVHKQLLIKKTFTSDVYFRTHKYHECDVFVDSLPTVSNNLKIYRPIYGFDIELVDRGMWRTGISKAAFSISVRTGHWIRISLQAQIVHMFTHQTFLPIAQKKINKRTAYTLDLAKQTFTGFFVFNRSPRSALFLLGSYLSFTLH